MTDPIEALLAELNEIAREWDEYEYGLPFSEEPMVRLREAVEHYRTRIIEDERTGTNMKWTTETPKEPGIYKMRSKKNLMSNVRLAFGGYEGDLPLIYFPGVQEPMIDAPEGAEWAK